ncbi:MAG: SDR family oxidoreductase, partial [Anaerolineaceae bacterium]
MILVTGAAGHLGNVLIRELLAQNEQVRAMILPGEDVSSLEGLNVELVEADVLNPAALEGVLQGIDTVYHLAGIISILPGSETLMEKVNVQGAGNVAEAALKAGVKRMVHTSSIHAFRRMPHGITVDESTPIAADSPKGTYDCAKANGTLAVREAVTRGLDAVIVCPTGVIGPYDFRNSEMGQTILNFSRGGLKLLVDGAYDFVDVRDVALSMILAARYGRTGETYILSGQRILVREIMQIVHELVGNRISSIVLPIRLADLFARMMEPIYTLTKRVPRFTRYSLQTLRDNSVFSHEKARRELGHNPRGLRLSIADTLEWWRERE